MTGLQAIEAKEELLLKIARAMPAVLYDLVDEYREYILDLNRGQLREGKRADGSKISPPYTPYTIKQKQKKGQPTNKVTLFDKGDFYADYEMKKNKQSIVLRNNNEKAKQLENKYGKGIHGLTNENIDKLREKMKPRIILEISKRFL